MELLQSITEAHRWVRLAGSLMLVVVSVWIAAYGRRHIALPALALVLFILGLSQAVNAVDDRLWRFGVGTPMGWGRARLGLEAVGIAAFVWLASVFPRPLPFATRRNFQALAAATGLVLVLLAVFPQSASPEGGAEVGPLTILAFVPVPAVASIALLWAWVRERDPSLRRSAFLVAAGMTTLATFHVHANLFGAIGRLAGGAALEGYPVWLANVNLAMALVGAAFFPTILVLAARGARAGDRAEAAFVAGLASAATALLLAARMSTSGALANLPLGFPLVVFPILVTYGLLRQSFLGIDLKLRFAISKSTVAAAFVAAFFVASEGAQILFGAGNEWMGLVAAGALVFAIAPLQRVAERLAEKAVPIGAAPPRAPEPRGVDREAVYRAAVRAALADGAMTDEEERHLAEAQEHLGLGPLQALGIRREIERELGVRS